MSNSIFKFDHIQFQCIMDDLQSLGLEVMVEDMLNYRGPLPYIEVTFIFKSKDDLNLYRIAGTTFNYINDRTFKVKVDG